ncbi:hypothetical protein BIV57_21145 [Mangrovactinospora gilvigrisea]|uniref:ANTAR domain-containing protein n=2 Tax=Mangrovactinospora gilvigrisea TaxID=1428644 RepID=A0A1J7BPX7_9ACTN|nr:hypothetical protein BIV57_21145 [Mangrovactinospora gilvigrisea]
MRFLVRLRRAARAGQSLENIPEADSAGLFGQDALTVDAATPDHGLQLLWCDPSDGFGRDLDDLQFALGDGPGPEAARSGLDIDEPDLEVVDPARWPGFLPAAADTPARALIALPLRLGTVTVGVLTGYRTAPGRLTDEQLHALHRLRRALLPLLLQTKPALNNGPHAPPGLHNAEIHQATGYLAVQLGIGIQQALLRIRARAVSEGESPATVARAVLDGTLSAEAWF